MRKGSYGRSKLIGHSPIQRKWTIDMRLSGFTDIAHFAIFYVNTTNTNITTVNDIGSPILKIQVADLRIKNVDPFYDLTKIIQTYNSGCYFFAWIDSSGQIPGSQLLTVANSLLETDSECFIFTPAFETEWRNGPSYSPIPTIRGIFINNPALPFNNEYPHLQNELGLRMGDPNK